MCRYVKSKQTLDNLCIGLHIRAAMSVLLLKDGLSISLVDNVGILANPNKMVNCLQIGSPFNYKVTDARSAIICY